MKHLHIALLVLGVVLITQVAAPLNCSDDKAKVECNGKFKGQIPTDAEMKEILHEHAIWVMDNDASPELGDPEVTND
jgi:hypothetical protein